MNLTRKKQDQAPAADAAGLAELQERAAALKVLEDHHDEAERGAECAEQAQALRETIAGTVEAAADRLAAAEQEAARILADARRALQETQQQAAKVERDAAKVEDTARCYQAAAKLAGLATEARRQAEKLAQERQDALGTADALTNRLTDLNARQGAAQAALEAAQAQTDAEAAGQALQTAQGIAAVIPTIAAQRDAAAARARAIGTEDTGGEYAAALAAVARFTQERETALDNARPERREARYVTQPGLRLAEMIAAHPTLVQDWASRAADQATTPQPNVIHRHADGRISGNVRHTH